jgi:hypothetical protein
MRPISRPRKRSNFIARLPKRFRLNDHADRDRPNSSAMAPSRGNHANDLELSCSSDSYKFDLTGEFEADEPGRFSSRWTEHSRDVGGTAIGTMRDDTLQVHVEKSVFAANLQLVTRGRRQFISLYSHGAGQTVTAAITLQRA